MVQENPPIDDKRENGVCDTNDIHNCLRVFHLISSLFICTRADVISECANATSCIGTYADIYKSLASDVNSFNIKSALYPANEPSSVLIFVNIYGQNGPDKTGNDSMPAVMKYIWSLRSLYAAFSAVFPEISSLFSVNSFNIKSALYPANEPSSVLIFVNIYGQNGPDKTGNDSMPAVMKYIWSLRSLYAAFSAVFLEISSLFSILRTPRTQELNITIPFFCCNVSVKDRKRMIKTVLAAVSISISYLY